MKNLIKKIVTYIFIRIFNDKEISHFCNDLQNKQVWYFVKKTKKKLPSVEEMLGFFKDK